MEARAVEPIEIQCYRVRPGYVVHLPFRRTAGPGEILEGPPPEVVKNQSWKLEPCHVLKRQPPAPFPAPLHPDLLKDNAWAGRRCFILGGGPSLNKVNLDSIRRGELVIAVNRAHELIDPTVIFSMDSRFYRWLLEGEFGLRAMRRYRDSAAWKVFADTHGFKFGPEVQTVISFPEIEHDSLETGIRRVDNSGLMALKLAVALGANPIYLLGFDLHQKGGRQQWWHDGYKIVNKDNVYGHFLDEFKDYLPEIKSRAVQVINLNPDSALRLFEFGKMPEKPLAPLFVSFYTPGLYAEKAATLRLSLHRLGLDYRIDEVDNLGSWDANTKHKAEFILKMLEAHPGRDIIWVDADAVIRQYPAALFSIEGDLAVHYRKDRELLSGTIFLRNTLKVRDLVKLWIRENAANPLEWEQRTLQRILDKPGRFGRPRVKVEKLPATYCQIFDIMRGEGIPVVEHFQASRAAKMQEQVKQKKGLSIIIPAWKSASFLERCLDSLAGQTSFRNGADYEILLGIDACEQTRDKALKIADQYKNLKTFWFEKHGGPYLIRNSLALLAEYDRLLFFDSDDTADPDMVRLALENERVKQAPVTFMLYQERENGVPGKPKRTCGVFFIDKAVFLQVGGLLPWKCAADTEFGKRLSWAGIAAICIEDKILVHRHAHPNQLTSNPETGHGSALRNDYIKKIKELSRLGAKKVDYASTVPVRIF